MTEPTYLWVFANSITDFINHWPLAAETNTTTRIWYAASSFSIKHLQRKCLPSSEERNKEQDEGQGSHERMHFPGAGLNVDAKVALRQSSWKCQMVGWQKIV